MTTRAYPWLFLLVISSVLHSSGCVITNIGAARGESFTAVTSIPDGKSLVYVYMPKKWGRQTYLIRVNSYMITRIQKGGYFPLMVDPGRIEVSSAGRGAVTIDAEAGATYYVKMTAGAKEPRLEAESPERGMKQLERCVLLDPVFIPRIVDKSSEHIVLRNYREEITIRTGETYLEDVHFFLSSNRIEYIEYIETEEVRIIGGLGLLLDENTGKLRLGRSIIQSISYRVEDGTKGDVSYASLLLRVYATFIQKRTLSYYTSNRSCLS